MNQVDDLRYKEGILDWIFFGRPTEATFLGEASAEGYLWNHVNAAIQSFFLQSSEEYFRWSSGINISIEVDISALIDENPWLGNEIVKNVNYAEEKMKECISSFILTGLINPKEYADGLLSNWNQFVSSLSKEANIIRVVMRTNNIPLYSDPFQIQ